jgi:hypothetical protein
MKAIIKRFSTAPKANLLRNLFFFFLLMVFYVAITYFLITSPA